MLFFLCILFLQIAHELFCDIFLRRLVNANTERMSYVSIHTYAMGGYNKYYDYTYEEDKKNNKLLNIFHFICPVFLLIKIIFLSQLLVWSVTEWGRKKTLCHICVVT